MVRKTISALVLTKSVYGLVLFAAGHTLLVSHHPQSFWPTFVPFFPWQPGQEGQGGDEP